MIKEKKRKYYKVFINISLSGRPEYEFKFICNFCKVYGVAFYLYHDELHRLHKDFHFSTHEYMQYLYVGCNYCAQKDKIPLENNKTIFYSIIKNLKKQNSLVSNVMERSCRRILTRIHAINKR